MNKVCPPCNRNCEQGDICPARVAEPLPDHEAALYVLAVLIALLLAVLLLTEGT